MNPNESKQELAKEKDPNHTTIMTRKLGSTKEKEKTRSHQHPSFHLTARYKNERKLRYIRKKERHDM